MSDQHGPPFRADHVGSLLRPPVVVATVHDPATAVLTMLVAAGAELAVFIPFTYRHTRRTRD